MENCNSCDPEINKVFEEQLLRWFSPEELSRMNQQISANPHLARWSAEIMKDLRIQDCKRAAERMQHASPEDMARLTDSTKQMAKATPEEIVAFKANADAQDNYRVSAANLLKQEGNELHSRGKYHEAASKYKHAMDIVNNMNFSAAARTLRLQSSLNLMSCYLKTGQFNECIKEGTEVLSQESKNVKALYRRGQAYRELGNFEAALVDLKKAHENSPDDKTLHVFLEMCKISMMDKNEQFPNIRKSCSLIMCFGPSADDHCSCFTVFSCLAL